MISLRSGKKHYNWNIRKRKILRYLHDITSLIKRIVYLKALRYVKSLEENQIIEANREVRIIIQNMEYIECLTIGEELQNASGA